MNNNLPKSLNTKNYVFFGEAGCGKSEISVNLALKISELGRNVHFFDMDMTKPLFRSRDLEELFRENNINLHFEKQFMDAPTMVGGINFYLKDQESATILDVGGDYIGARSAGAFAPRLNDDSTALYYIINPFRPWSDTIEHIDMVLSDILAVSHVDFSKLKFIANPNLGPNTCKEDFIRGYEFFQNLNNENLKIDFYTADEKYADEVKTEIKEEVLPLRLYMKYPWD